MSDDTVKKYTKKDFTSGRDVKWCPGCGDYAILATVQRVMAELGNPKENHNGLQPARELAVFAIGSTFAIQLLVARVVRLRPAFVSQKYFCPRYVVVK